MERDRFEQIFLPQRERLLAYLVGLTGEREAALDAAQETLLAAWRDIEAFREESAPLTWLVGIARRIVFRQTRRATRRERLLGSELARERGAGSAAAHARDEQASAARDSEPGGALEQREREERVRAAVLCLARERREAVVLHYFAGMSVAEIATAMRTREGTIKSRLARARMELSKRLESDL